MIKTLTLGLLLVLFQLACQKKDDPHIALLITNSPTELVNTQVKISARLTKDLELGNIYNYGFVYSELAQPTIDNAKSILYLPHYDMIRDFQAVIDSLKPATTYYCRALLTLQGQPHNVIYGNEITFSTPAHNTWSYSSRFPDSYGKMAFKIENKLYAGVFGHRNQTQSSNQFWEYNAASDQWSRKADFPGYIFRDGHTMFSVNGKAYVGMGIDSSGKSLTDFWEYNPTSDTWLQKRDFPGQGPIKMVAFSIDNKAYVGMGSSNPEFYVENYHTELWEYDSQVDTWTPKAAFPGKKRLGPVVFTIGEQGYLLSGLTIGEISKECWQYNPTTDTWLRKADIADVGRWMAFGFSVNDKGYIGGGIGPNNTYKKDFWEYNPTNDTWLRKVDLTTEHHEIFAAFGVEDAGYGWNGRVFHKYIF